jgi:hypothetical protein
MDRRDELERWIANSRATKQRLKQILLVAGAISLVLSFISRPAGAIGLVIVAFVAAAGFWITNGHIADWEDKIYKLEHPEKPSTGTTRKRRYEAD